MYPETSQEYVRSRAFEITMELSKNTIKIEQGVYTLTDLAVEIGGLSRAVYAAGLIFAHYVALQLYRTAVVKDLFMV